MDILKGKRYDIMNVLWEEGRPLSAFEINDIAPELKMPTVRRCLEMSFILFLIGFMKFMVFILHHFLVWLPQLPAVHLLFYWAAALLKCFVHFWVPVPEIIFERR